MTKLILTAICVLLCTLSVIAQTGDANREAELASLRGVRSISVVASGLPLNENRSGLDAATIERDVREGFQLNGLRAVPVGSDYDATFALSVKARYSQDTDAYCFLVRAQLKQLAKLSRVGRAYVIATWEREKLILIPSRREELQTVRNAVTELVLEFAVDWRSVNGTKRPPSKSPITTHHPLTTNEARASKMRSRRRTAESLLLNDSGRRV